MPGWHDAVKDLVADGKLCLLGVTQEQHAERCRLFAQWQQFEWPILHDPINLLRSKAVPIVIAIDEHGIVRSKKPTKSWVREEFVPTKYAESTDTKAEVLTASKGDQAMLWNAAKPSVAVQEYKAALQNDASAINHFRLGVALRARHDSSYRQVGDFMNAVTHWTAALEMDPNQYIWRRRIQQYGPRLKKPYPFYDWVDKATAAIKKRGETPIKLRVPLSGAEIAAPAKSFVVVQETQTSPDPKNRITRDERGYVSLNVAAAPVSIKSGESLRLHLEFSPLGRSTLWNNEAEPLRVWLEPTDAWQPERNLLTYEGDPGASESAEARRVEVEIKSVGKPGKRTINGFALYNVCEKVGGQCLLRRQDFSVEVEVQ